MLTMGSNLDTRGRYIRFEEPIRCAVKLRDKPCSTAIHAIDVLLLESGRQPHAEARNTWREIILRMLNYAACSTRRTTNDAGIVSAGATRMQKAGAMSTRNGWKSLIAVLMMTLVMTFSVCAQDNATAPEGVDAPTSAAGGTTPEDAAGSGAPDPAKP